MGVSSLVHCIGGYWSPKIGDPNVTGWVTVVVYGLCAAAGFGVALRRPHRAGRVFWLILTGIMAFLAINKQLDLQSVLTAAGRCLAHAQGWYGNRHQVQLLVIGGIGLFGLLVLIGLGAVMWGRALRNLVAFFGLVIVSSYVAVRAVGFHHLDKLLGVSVGGGVTFNFAFETSGLLLILLNALWHLRAPDDPAPHGAMIR